MFRSISISCAVLISLLLASNVQAACTYSEAVMALNNGNPIRGQALMKMAARDGDQRAVQFLTLFEQHKEQSHEAGKKTLSDMLLVLDTSAIAQTTREAAE